MTRIEKEVVIRALSEYEKTHKKNAEKERKRGEMEKAANEQYESTSAGAIMMAFCSILNEPCGSCKI